MIKPATLPLAGGRFVPFVLTIEVQNVNLTGATLDMHIRLTPDTPGTALVDLSPAAAGSQGLSLVYNAGTGHSTITIQIDETTMETLGTTAGREVGTDLEVAWDMHITRTGVPKAVWFRGPFTVEAGVTQ